MVNLFRLKKLIVGNWLSWERWKPSVDHRRERGGMQFECK